MIYGENVCYVPAAMTDVQSLADQVMHNQVNRKSKLKYFTGPRIETQMT